MNQIETIIPIESRASIDIGKRGESLVRKVLFDILPWQEQYGPAATYAIVFERPDGSIYPLTAVVDGQFCFVIITSNETAVGGPGHLEVRLYLDDQLRKSQRFITLCATSVLEPGEPPDTPTKGWIDHIMAQLSGANVPVNGKADQSTLTLGRALQWDDLGRLAVDVADEAGADKTKPVSEAFVDSMIGNIEILLKTL